MEEAKNRTRATHDMMMNRPKLDAPMEQHMSVASEELVKIRPNWDVISGARDPLLQHLAIRETHIVENSGDPDTDAQEARNDFGKLRMHGEIISEFHQAFEYAVSAIRATSSTFYTDEMLASEFVLKLDHRFAQFKLDIDNGAIRRPSNLAWAFNRASRYRVAASS